MFTDVEVKIKLKMVEKINFYKERLLWWQENIDTIEKQQHFAEFLTRPTKQNTEKFYLVKCGGSI